MASGLSPSKGAARRTIAEGGVSVNNTKVDSEEWTPRPADFLHGRWLVLRRASEISPASNASGEPFTSRARSGKGSGNNQHRAGVN
ncbi:S4 domain protein [Mycobacterium xenopi 3993]|nr:S4 domain protein [Mycobacterium xenopi 3993]